MGMTMPTRAEMPGIWNDVINESRQNPGPRQTQKQAAAMAMRMLCLQDLYYLLSQILSCGLLFQNEAINQDWLYYRVREIEMAPNGYLDLAAREHFKSTIGTFGLTIQDV